VDKIQKQQLLVAKCRKAEIARKVKAQNLQSSGYVRSQLSGLTSPDRLIECDHYMLKGKAAELSNKREEYSRKVREHKAKTQKLRHVKKREGVTLSVTEIIKTK
jgi:hypothetical protein